MRPAALFPVGACLFAAIGVWNGTADDPVAVLRLAVCGAALAFLAMTDLREHRIPNRVVLPAAALCAALAGRTTLDNSLPALGIVAALFLVALLRPAVLGMGDIEEALLIALALGAAATSALVFGLVLAALAGVALILRRGRAALGIALPLGPFLALGATVALALT